jgi:NADH-ubiquinone oxidoreductase chain 5
MAAPTPVSSLVHSSTLVTAGVYLLFRFREFLRLSQILPYILLMGTLTMLMAGASAIFEIDIKKIVALSTLSQLGIIIAAIGIGLYEVAFFHILAHAYFKALLFMSVGNMIHLSSDFQDLRKIGLTAHSLPVTLAFRVVANLSLCGLPFISGFYSKDLIIELAIMGSPNLSILIT